MLNYHSIGMAVGSYTYLDKNVHWCKLGGNRDCVDLVRLVKLAAKHPLVTVIRA